MTTYLVENGAFESELFFLVDVGASGGIEQHWRIFGGQLRALGFDPLVKECSRLNSAEPSSAVRYHAAYIGAHTGDARRSASLFSLSGGSGDAWSNQPFPRTSAVRALQIMNMSYVERYNNEDEDLVFSDEHISLDEYFDTRPGETIDFIKIDTDGDDYEVLRGSEHILTNRKVLGLFVECQFHGEIDPKAGIFSNIDKFLREKGFSLFDIEVYRYTRGCLPGRFIYDIPAQTRTGQVIWGDALYLRDLAIPGYEENWNVHLSREKLIKLACLFETYGMPDCAAELLQCYKDRVGDKVNVETCLNLLTANVAGGTTQFRDYNNEFETAPEGFYTTASLPE